MSKIYTICARHDENLMSLFQEAKYLGHDLIPFYLNKNNTLETLYKQVNQNDYVIVLHTNFGSELLHHLVSRINCKKFLNANAYKQSLIGDKLYQQNILQRIEPSITIPTYTASNIPDNFISPFIGKPRDSSCGKGVMLFASKEETKTTASNYIFQPFIKNDGDWRVIVIGGKSVSSIKRLGRVNQVTNNLATGSFAITEQDPKTVETIYGIAEIASKSMNFDYVGIDVIKDLDSNKYYFLESNERPTFETSQILTGINIAKYIIMELVK